MGFHNIDLSFNMLRLEKFCKIRLVDVGVFGREQSAVEGYSVGICMLLTGMVLNIVSFMGIIINILRDK